MAPPVLKNAVNHFILINIYFVVEFLD